MELKDLVGLHELSGVDFSTEAIKQWGNKYEDCETVSFVLDDTVYTAIEDPDDGYRSSMREIRVGDVKVKNVFAPVNVLARMQKMSNRYADSVLDILELLSLRTGKVILAVGTDNEDDYYPMWVASFHPENI